MCDKCHRLLVCYLCVFFFHYAIVTVCLELNAPTRPRYPKSEKVTNRRRENNNIKGGVPYLCHKGPHPSLCFSLSIFFFLLESLFLWTRHHLHWTAIITRATLHHITIATIIIIGKNKEGRWEGSTFSSLWFLWLWLWSSQVNMACAWT